MSVKQVIKWETTDGKTFENKSEAIREDVRCRFLELVTCNTYRGEFCFDDFFNSLRQDKELMKDSLEESRECDLQKIVDFLQKECSGDDMASVKINNEGNVYLGVGIHDKNHMTIAQFATLMEEKL